MFTELATHQQYECNEDIYCKVLLIDETTKTDNHHLM